MFQTDRQKDADIKAYDGESTRYQYDGESTILGTVVSNSQEEKGKKTGRE